MKTKEQRIYGIDANEFNWLDENNVLIDIEEVSDEEFMDKAEQQGNVWSIAGFVIYHNENEASQMIIRLIEV